MLKNIFVSILLFTVIGCGVAVVKKPSDRISDKAMQISPLPNKALLYVIRPMDGIWNCFFKVSIDYYKLFGWLGPKTYLVAQIDPGEHRLPVTIHHYSNKEIDMYGTINGSHESLNFEHGKTYYLLTDYKSGLLSMPNLYSLTYSQLDEKKGKEYIAKFKLSGENELEYTLFDKNLNNSQIAKKAESTQPTLKKLPVKKTVISETNVSMNHDIPDLDDVRINTGNYFALIIGNNNYKFMQPLETPIDDSKAIKSLLVDQYDFQVTLLNDATRYEILSALNGYRTKLTPQDNLLIYYAGHGWLDVETGEGYWFPVDSEADNPTNWIANSSITNTLKAMKAKHVMIVSDSCYSGTLARSTMVSLKTYDYLQRISKKRARTVISSGGIEPVIDSGGKGNHSVFATAFIECLENNTINIIETSYLFNEIRRAVILNSDQTPEYSDIRKAGHDGGEFLFVRKQ